jgi:hypothetical protein
MLFAGVWKHSMAGDETPSRSKEASGEGRAKAMECDDPLQGMRHLFEQGREAEQSGPSIEERCRAYIEKKRKEEEKARDRLKDIIRCDWLEYETIKNKNQEEMKAARVANSATAAKMTSIGSFVDPIDGRLAITGLTIFRGNKSVVTTSFDPRTLSCRGCSGHLDKKIWRERS